jgi:hypothetical protein
VDGWYCRTIVPTIAGDCTVAGSSRSGRTGRSASMTNPSQSHIGQSTPAGACDRIHSRSVASPTRA